MGKGKNKAGTKHNNHYYSNHKNAGRNASAYAVQEPVI